MSKRRFLIFTWCEKKIRLLQSKRSESLCYAHYFALPKWDMSPWSISRVTGECLRWCVRIQLVFLIRIPPANRARRRCIRNEMRMKCDTPLIAIKMDTNGHRRGRNRQIKRVTSKTPKSCRKTTSWSWCVKGEDQLARCAKNKLRVHHKAAIKSIRSHSEKIIATFLAPFSHEKLPISVNFSQNFRQIFALIFLFETADFLWNCRRNYR